MRTARILVCLALAILLVGAGLAALGAASGWFGRDATDVDSTVIAAQWAPARDYLAALDEIAAEACAPVAPVAPPTVEERYERVRGIVDLVIADLAAAGIPRPGDIPGTAPRLPDRLPLVCRGR